MNVKELTLKTRTGYMYFILIQYNIDTTIKLIDFNSIKIEFLDLVIAQFRISILTI